MESLNKKIDSFIIYTRTFYSKSITLPMNVHAAGLIQILVTEFRSKNLIELFAIRLLRSDNAKEKLFRNFSDSE